MSRHELTAFKKAKHHIASNHRLVVPALGAILVVILIVFVALTNSVATQGYKLTALENQINDLKKQNDDIQLNVTAIQSLPYVKAQASTVSLAPVTQIEYLATNGSAVALR